MFARTTGAVLLGNLPLTGGGGRLLRIAPLLAAFLIPAQGQPRIDAVVNVANYLPQIAPESIVAIFGANLANDTVQATSVPLPSRLSQTAVKVCLTATNGCVDAGLIWVWLL